MERQEEGAELRVTGLAGSGERAEEPGDARDRQQRAGPALRATRPGGNAGRDEDDADDEIGDGETDIGRRRSDLERSAPKRGPLGEEAKRGGGREERQPQRAHYATSAASDAPESSLFGRKPRAGARASRPP